MPKSVFLCTPAYQGVSNSYLESKDRLERWLRDQGIRHDTARVGGIPVDAARELLAAKFMSTDFDLCLMIDAGIGFQVETIERMLNADKEFTCAAGPLRQLSLSRVAERAAEGLPQPERFVSQFYAVWDAETVASGRIRLEKGFTKIERTGGAVMMIARSVFEKLYDSYPKLRHERGCAYFIPEVIDGQRYGEDAVFYKRWRDIGGEVHMLVDAPLVHEGMHIYAGNFADSLG